MFSVLDLLIKHIFTGKQRLLGATNTVPARSETIVRLNKYLCLNSSDDENFDVLGFWLSYDFKELSDLAFKYLSPPVGSTE